MKTNNRNTLFVDVNNVTPLRKDEKKYPYIGIFQKYGNYSIVLFTSENSGVQLATSGGWGNDSDILMRYHDAYGEASFQPFKGTITLSNEEW